MQENDKFFCAYKRYKICPRMEIPTTKYLADYLYVVHEDVPFRYYRKTKCSIFRLVLLCLCLNISYSNIVRFPRELDKHGTAFLIPYVSLLCLVGFPLILLEVSVGQFLGQGSAHTWRASPIFKGASIVGRFASWLASLWISLQAVFAVGYIGMFTLTSFPFRDCTGNIKLAYENGYSVIGNSGQECLQRTFLLPFWTSPFYFGVLAVGLIGIWIVVMLCTHNGTSVRRSVFLFGLLGFILLVSLAGWEVHNALQRGCFPQLWPFDIDLLLDSNLWFAALLQVLYGTSCGFGVLPVLTGKFLYKGDAVRTSLVYLCFGLLINAVAVTLFMVQFDLSANGNFMIDELKPLTAIYDRMVYDKPSNELLVTLTPCLIYALVVLSAAVSIIVAVYSSTRLVPRHPVYVANLFGLVMTIMALAAPQFIVGRVLDSRIVGTLVITSLVFELIALTWIYGTQNLYTDLEFSIGRPIFKGWMALWLICPAILTGILVWWCSDDDRYDVIAVYLPRWAPILFVLGVIFISAAVQIFRQFEYNFFGMICEASKSAKEWGPADPLARHAWKQWRSVCQHTGRRDYTLRRRGTRDYTHSVKRASKLANGHASQPANWKCSTPGNSSPNYSGSMFGDSAIEEDMSVDKYPVVPSYPSYRKSQHTRVHRTARAKPNAVTMPTTEQHREIVYIGSYDDVAAEQHAARIEITPSNESITYGATRNPLSRPAAAEYHGNGNGSTTTFIKRSDSHRQPTVNSKLPPSSTNGHREDEHVCWRRFPYDGKNFATEL